MNFINDFKKIMRTRTEISKSSKENSSEKGIATIEAVLLLSVFVVFMTYCVGTFGVIHTGILNSISARAYAFETFRNRSNLTYFRDTTGDKENTAKYGVRVHGIATEKASSDEALWNVTERTLAQGREIASLKHSLDTKNQDLRDFKKEKGVANPVWIKTAYGICLNWKCGGD